MTTKMRRRGEPRGMMGWPKNAEDKVKDTSLEQALRLCVKCDAKGNSQLDLSHRGLTLIPHQVFQFQQLDVLKLSHNRLDHLPPAVSYLRGIRTLRLDHNALVSLPPTLVNCRHLSELDLSSNRLTAIPRGIKALKALRILKLAHNELEQVPHELGSLAKLRVLELRSNRLWYVPFSLQNLYHLLRLDLADNLFDQIPLVVTKLTWIRALDLSRNRLAVLPPDFDQLKELRELNLSENRFVALGTMATKLRQLKYLSLSHNRLQFLPEQISSLKNLSVLHVRDNCLESLPEHPPRLKYLNVSRNKLEHFSVLRATQLVALDASDNQLQALPRGLFHLKELRRLNLARNALSEVPEDIGWLKKLQWLDVSDNDLCSLPGALHFMDKLTSFNARGNHNISRQHPSPAAPQPDGEQTQAGAPAAEMAGETGGGELRAHTPRAGRKRRGKLKGLRPYASMPSLQHAASTARLDSAPDSPAHPRGHGQADWTQGQDHPATNLDQIWLDNFLLAKPQRKRRRGSWDGNTTVRTARSVPYPLDERYDMGEIRASFSAESLASRDKKSHRLHGSLSERSLGSDENDDSALDASFNSADSNQLENEGLRDAWLMDHHYRRSAGPMKKSHKSAHTTSSSKSVATEKTDPNRSQTQKKTPYSVSSSAIGNPYPHEAQDPANHNLGSSSAPKLGIYNYSDGKEVVCEPRQMHVLMTNASRAPSRHSTLRSKRTAANAKSRETLRSDSNWTMRSHMFEPLTIHTWTQTPGEPLGPHAPREVTPVTDCDLEEGFVGLRSPDSPPMLASLSLSDGHLKPGPSPLLQPSSASSSTALPQAPASESRPHLRSGTFPPSRHTQEGEGRPMKTTDYTLLGLCNQIQTLLHKDLLQPVIGFNGQRNNRYSATPHKALHLGPAEAVAWQQGAGLEAGAEPGAGLEAGLEYSPGETFTTTERGGHYASAFCPSVQVSVPPGAVNKTLHVTLQQLTISYSVLKIISESDSYVSNIISMGPIIFLNALEKVTFASPVTLTLPAPSRLRGQQGHLVVVSVRHDNTCVPCTTGYQSSRREVTLTTWHMTGKVAIVTKARCKYKACKSVEQLLTILNIMALNARH